MGTIIWTLVLVVLGPLLGWVCGGRCQPRLGLILLGPCLILAGGPPAVALWQEPAAWPWLLGLLLIDLLLVVVPYRIFRWARWSTARVTTASRRR